MQRLLLLLFTWTVLWHFLPYLSYSQSRDCTQISQECQQIMCCDSPLISMKHGTRQIVPSQTLSDRRQSLLCNSNLIARTVLQVSNLPCNSKFCTGEKLQTIAREWTCDQNLPGVHIVSAFLCIHELVFRTRILVCDVRDVILSHLLRGGQHARPWFP